MKITEKIPPIVKFVKSDIWYKDFGHLSKLNQFFINILRMGVIVTKGFFEDELPLMSSALTFATILGLVPFLALMFSILKGFGVHEALETAVINKLAMGSHEIVSRIFEYINQVNVKSIGAAGLAVLVFTVLFVVKNVEVSFNKIWGVKRKRGFFRSFSDYLSVILIGPVLVFAALSLTATIKAEGTFFMDKLIASGVFPYFIISLKGVYPKIFKAIPFVFMCGFFVFVYSFMPNTKVKFSAAVLGGIVGASLWQAASVWYINFQMGMRDYGAIYGGMAQLPVLLVWIYLSWMIILFGAEIAFAFQNLKTFGLESRSLTLSQDYKEVLALRASLLIAKNFQLGNKMSSQEIAVSLDVPLRLVNQILFELTASNILVEASKDKSVYIPAKDLENIKIADVILALRNFGGGELNLEGGGDFAYIKTLKSLLDESLSKTLSDKTLKDAVNELS